MDSGLHGASFEESFDRPRSARRIQMVDLSTAGNVELAQSAMSVCEFCSPIREFSGTQSLVNLGKLPAPGYL